MDNPTNVIESAKTWLDYAEQLGPTLVAITAIIVTFLIAKYQIKGAFLAAQHQIKATATTASRRQWIETLRDDLAKFMALQHVYSIYFDKVPKESQDEESRRTFKEMTYLFRKIELLITADDKDHNELIKALYDYNEVWAKNRDNGNKDNTGAVILRLSKAGRKVIDKEWSRIKSGQ